MEEPKGNNFNPSSVTLLQVTNPKTGFYCRFELCYNDQSAKPSPGLANGTFIADHIL